MKPDGTREIETVAESETEAGFQRLLRKICGKDKVDKYFKDLQSLGAEGPMQEGDLEFALSSAGELDQAKLDEFNEACKHIVENLGAQVHQPVLPGHVDDLRQGQSFGRVL
eukprot:SAG31_NODE_3450_length_4256_cov_7.431080_5_plen_111_part_00